MELKYLEQIDALLAQKPWPDDIEAQCDAISNKASEPERSFIVMRLDAMFNYEDEA